jgi:hypothetical protein
VNSLFKYHGTQIQGRRRCARILWQMGVLGAYCNCLQYVNALCQTPQNLLTTGPGAFLSALIVGVSLHYHKIVQNEYYGYPDEWFPSVSSTIGDRYPERSFFMVFIGITSGMGWKMCSRTPRLTRYRSSICSSSFVVPPHGSTQLNSPEVRCWYGRIQKSDMRGLDICYVDG